MRIKWKKRRNYEKIMFENIGGLRLVQFKDESGNIFYSVIKLDENLTLANKINRKKLSELYPSLEMKI